MIKSSPRPSLLDRIAGQRHASNIYKSGGYALKIPGDAVKTGGVGGQLGRLVSPVVGSLMIEGGQFVIDRANKDLQTKILIEINTTTKKGLLDGNGKIDKDLLLSLDETDVRFVLKPEFWAEVGDPTVTAQFFQQLNTIQLATALKGIDELSGDLDGLDKRLKAKLNAAGTLTSFAKQYQAYARQTTEVVREVQDQVSRNTTLVEELANANLPNAQKLALVRAGVLNVGDAKDVLLLERAVRAEEVQGMFSNASGKLKAVAPVLAEIDPELGRMANDLTNVLDGGGMLAGAIVTGNPLAIANGAMSLFNAVSGFGKKPEPSPEQQALGMILEELRALREQIKVYH
jgi:hypothetical protein